MGEDKTYTVNAEWDDDAKVWATNGDDIPGLFVEAGTFDELVEIALDLAPDLLRGNAGLAAGTQIAITLVGERRMTLVLP